MIVGQGARSAREINRRLEYSRTREDRQKDAIGCWGRLNHARVRGQIARIAQLASASQGVPPTVLILGETGSGKDVAARLLRRASPREGRPFVHVDCGALPMDLVEAELFGHEKGAFTQAHAARAGLIEAAEDGTAFLDEVGDLPLDLQAKLLALLGRRSLRRIGSTEERRGTRLDHCGDEPGRRGHARGGDPALGSVFSSGGAHPEPTAVARARDDVLLLARRFAAQTARRYGLREPRLSADAVAAPRDYPWPGNVRELNHLVERAVLSPRCTAERRGPRFRRRGTRRDCAVWRPHGLDGLTFEATEAAMIEGALERCGDNVSQAARRLGITRMAMRYRMQKYGLPSRGV